MPRTAAPAAARRAVVGPGVGLVLAALVTAGTLAGCASAEVRRDPDVPVDAGSPAASSPAPTGGSGSSAPGEPTASATRSAADVEVSIRGDRVSPRGERVEAAVGEPVTFSIDAEVPGELHVHTSPEQLVEFPAGRSVVEITVERPGVVDVELHEPPVTLVQLEVR